MSPHLLGGVETLENRRVSGLRGRVCGKCPTGRGFGRAASDGCTQASRKSLRPQLLFPPVTKAKNGPGQIFSGCPNPTTDLPCPFPSGAGPVLSGICTVPPLHPHQPHPEVTPALLLETADSNPGHLGCRKGVGDFVLISHQNALLLHVLHRCGFSGNRKLSFLRENLHSPPNRLQLGKQGRALG